MRKITKHIVHCSDSPDDRAVTVADIDSWHRERGFNCIGYHYVIYRDGSLHTGRFENEVGAHCKGQNANSIGTCLIGRIKFTEEQFATLKKLHSELQERYSGIEAFGHRDFDPHKTCPNFEVKEAL